MVSRGKDSLTDSQIRRQVDQVMDRWSSYPSFAKLFDDLLLANGVSTNAFADSMADHGRPDVTEYSAREYRTGEREPPYIFIEHLADSNLLHFDPARIRREQNDQPSGDQRVALFTAAGMIEVTPESIARWNKEVMAGHERFVQGNPDAPRPRWGDLMAKLLSFHLQGNRRSINEVAAEIKQFAPPDVKLTSARITNLLQNNRPANPNERAAFYRYAQLDERHIAYIENGIANELIPLGHVSRTTPFTQALNDVLDKLNGQGMNMYQLTHVAKTLSVPAGSTISPSDLSSWRLGRTGITLQKLRSLTATIEHLGPDRLGNPVTSDERDRLIRAAGFQPSQLTDTTHDIVARIGEETKINTLLQSLREAVDVSTTGDDICREGAQRGFTVPTLALLSAWERSGMTSPTPGQVRHLLEWYNQIVTDNGYKPLSTDEVSRVMAVAERDHDRWQRQSHTEKLSERNQHRRRTPPSPSFDGPERSR